ncbi:putative inorganic diphosphatase [Helianthus anomalus]
MTSATILSDLGTEILIPICAVKLVVEKPYADRKNRFTKALIEEEEGVNDYTVVGSPEKFTSAVYRQKSVTYRNLFGLMQWTVGSPEKFRRKSVSFKSWIDFFYKLVAYCVVTKRAWSPKMFEVYGSF